MVQLEKIIHSKCPRKASRPNFNALPFIYLLYNVPYTEYQHSASLLHAECSFPVDARTRTDLQYTLRVCVYVC